MPDGVEEGILQGLYRVKAGPGKSRLKAHILGSGPILNEALRAQQILADRYAVSADVWSATNYKLLRHDALRCRRWNMLHPTAPPKKSGVEKILGREKGVFVAVSDFIQLFSMGVTVVLDGVWRCPAGRAGVAARLHC